VWGINDEATSSLSLKCFYELEQLWLWLLALEHNIVCYL
jgi:hypothetical protein